MTDIIGTGANELAKELADELAADGETFGVLVFPAAVWATGSNGPRSVVPAWYLCMTLDIGDSSGVAHCEQIAPISPPAEAVRDAVVKSAAILRAQAELPQQQQTLGAGGVLWGVAAGETPAQVTRVSSSGPAAGAAVTGPRPAGVAPAQHSTLPGDALAAVDGILGRPAVTVESRT